MKVVLMSFGRHNREEVTVLYFLTYFVQPDDQLILHQDYLLKQECLLQHFTVRQCDIGRELRRPSIWQQCPARACRARLTNRKQAG